MRRLLPLTGLALLAAWAAFGEEKAPTAEVRPVQVREALLRDRPSFLGKIVRRLPYEAKVAVEKRPTDSAWLEVRVVDGGAQGWLKESALYPKSTELRAGSGGSGERAGQTTRSLAGRGFNAQVERARRAEARTSGSGIEQGYRKLDALLARPPYTVDPSDVPAFVREGELEAKR